MPHPVTRQPEDNRISDVLARNVHDRFAATADPSAEMRLHAASNRGCSATARAWSDESPSRFGKAKVILWSSS